MIEKGKKCLASHNNRVVMLIDKCNVSLFCKAVRVRQSRGWWEMF